MKLFLAILTMSRPINCLITFITISTACFICGGTIEILGLILIGSVVGTLVTAAGNIINDYYGIEADKINRPYRILPSEIVSPATALLFFLLINLAALLLAVLLGFGPFIIAAVTIMLLYLYSYKLKNIPLIGNFVVAFLTGLAFIFGSIIAGNVFCGIIPAVFAFMINLMREIIKDLEDIGGDKAVDLSSYPIKYGVVSSINLVSIIGASLIILTTLPFLFKIYSAKYFILVLLGVNGILVFVISRLRIDPSSYNLKIASNLLKLAMVLGIISIILGTSF